MIVWTTFSALALQRHMDVYCRLGCIFLLPILLYKPGSSRRFSGNLIKLTKPFCLTITVPSVFVLTLEHTLGLLDVGTDVNDAPWKFLVHCCSVLPLPFLMDPYAFVELVHLHRRTSMKENCKTIFATAISFLVLRCCMNVYHLLGCIFLLPVLSYEPGTSRRYSGDPIISMKPYCLTIIVTSVFVLALGQYLGLLDGGAKVVFGFTPWKFLVCCCSILAVPFLMDPMLW